MATATTDITWVTRAEVKRTIKPRILETDVVLEVGPGIYPQPYFRPRVHICVEPHRPYIERHRELAGGDPTYVYLNGTWESVLPLLPAGSVDSVFALEVIEHLEKDDGLRFLQEAARVARHQIVISTPLGYFPQDYDHPSKPDRWGMDGAYWQTHRSGWHPEDFGDGWDFVCCAAYSLVDQDEQPLEQAFGAIWGFRNLSASARLAATIPSRAGRFGRRLLSAARRRVPTRAKAAMTHQGGITR